MTPATAANAKIWQTPRRPTLFWTRACIIILKALGIPTSMFTVIFAIGRTVGWIAHWNEMIGGAYRIGRPRQLYTGQTQRDFVPLDKR